MIRVPSIPLKTGRGQNDRAHFYVRARSVKAEKYAIGIVLNTIQKPKLPARVLLRRVAPSGGLDDDNLSGAMKATRDAVAAWLGVDDADPAIKFAYDQRRGPWAVEIELHPGAES